MNTSTSTIYTIGHSNHSWQRFLELIGPHGLEMLVDVRSYPRSRFAPWSNRESLERALPKVGVEYLWMGDSLGGMQRGPKRLKNSPDVTVDAWYEARSKSDDFIAGIEKISRLAQQKRIAVMCSEGDPTRCHRSLLLAPAFQKTGIEVLHILPKTVGVTLPRMFA